MGRCKCAEPDRDANWNLAGCEELRQLKTDLGFAYKRAKEMQEEIERLRYKMPSELQLEFCANSDLHLELAKRETAKEIIQYILDQGTIEIVDGEEHCYYIIDDDIKGLKGKFGLQAND